MADPILSHPLFAGLSPEETHGLLQESARRRTYKKGARILSAGDTVKAFGLVLSGSVRIESVDVWGGRSILDGVEKGGIFAETYAWLGEPLLVDVTAAEEAEILFIDAARLSDRGQAACTALLRNLLVLSARKNLVLSRRILYTAAKTIRGRLLSYLSAQASAHRSAAFSIPFDRQQLADYLQVDRSALSAELGRMRDEGLLTFRKNRFELHVGR